MPADLYWLPKSEDLKAQSAAVEGAAESGARWAALVQMAKQRLDFLETAKVDRLLTKHFGDAPPAKLKTKPVRLAVLASSTIAHLLPSIRVAALRRGIWLTTYTGDYGQYLQDLTDTDSGLHQFRPDAMLFAFDSHHIAASGSAPQALRDIEHYWSLAKQICPVVLQQTLLPVFPRLLGQNEHRLTTSPRDVVARVNAGLREMSDGAGVHLVTVDDFAQDHGIDAWHSRVLWHKAKQDVNPLAAPFYGDLVGRLLAAVQGISSKCLVLDLDNTLWGGVIGDDGLEGIELGQGSAIGEAYVAMQKFAQQLAARGIILAVCSKNDEKIALSPFEKHPEMILKRTDIAAFVANWQDKASNIRAIAEALNIGIDSLVFADDNPFERAQVRHELPMVAIPELPEDPALYASCIADAGYFEALYVTDDDRARSKQYQANIERDMLKSSSSDMKSYLLGLGMTMMHGPFDSLGLKRTTQLINKTNQFNVTTKRYTEDEVRAFMQDPSYDTWQIRLTDRFGDNGIIAIVIAKAEPELDALVLDTWLMSCRVLGRQVEEATLTLIAEAARRRGFRRVIGEYRPTEKNRIVADLFEKLGFRRMAEEGLWELALRDYTPPEILMTLAPMVQETASV